MNAKVLLTGTDPANPRGGIGVAMAGYKSALEAANLLADLIPSYRPDVIGGRWWYGIRAAGRLGTAVWELRRRGVAPVVYAHGGRWLGLLRQALLLYAARTFGASTMLQLHSVEIDAYLEKRLGRAFLRFCFAPAELVCVLTDWWQERLEDAGIRKRLCVVPNPLPPDLETAAKEAATRKRVVYGADLRLLTITRLVSGKGVDLAIRSLCLLPDKVHLTIAGEGPQRSRLESLTAELGLQRRVRFTGWVDSYAKAELLRSSDVFLLPTRRDSFGMGFVEAMAHELPVVALRWGPIPCVVPENLAGLLIESPEPRALAAAIEELMDSAVRQRMGTAGRRWILERFSSRVVGKRLREAVAIIAPDAIATSYTR